MKSMKNFFFFPFRFVGKYFLLLTWTPARKNGAFLVNQVRRIVVHFRRLHRHQATAKADLSDFRQVLLCWGIRPAELPQVIKALSVHMVCLGVLACMGFWVLVISSHWMVTVQGVVLVVLGFLGVVVRFWRISVLIRQQWIPFRTWVSFGLIK